jgi:hypothetical protein
MEKLRYSDLLDRLEGFDAWLIKLGLTPRQNDRIHEAFKVLRKAEELSRKGQQTGEYADILPGDWFPVVEALEAHDVFAAFENDPSPAVAVALKRALSGPAQPIRENSKNRDGRNVWYELALAAEWRLRGAVVRLDEPDLCLTRDGVSFLIACKRPAHKNTIQANLDSAIKQLQCNLSSAQACTFGVAAISLSCTFNAGDRVFTGDMNGLRSHLESELDKYQRFFSTVANPRICCVLFHVVTPGLGGSKVDLVRASFTAAQELTPSLGSKIFEQHAQEIGSTPKQLWEHDVSD